MLESIQDKVGAWLQAHVPPLAAPYLFLICVFLVYLLVALWYDARLAEKKYTECANTYNDLVLCRGASDYLSSIGGGNLNYSIKEKIQRTKDNYCKNGTYAQMLNASPPYMRVD